MACIWTPEIVPRWWWWWCFIGMLTAGRIDDGGSEW